MAATKVGADFVAPLLRPSLPDVSLSYVYDPEHYEQEQTKSAHRPPRAYDDELTTARPRAALTLTNVSALPLQLVLQCPAPFTVSSRDLSLQPGQAESGACRSLGRFGPLTSTPQSTFRSRRPPRVTACRRFYRGGGGAGAD